MIQNNNHEDTTQFYTKVEHRLNPNIEEEITMNKLNKVFILTIVLLLAFTAGCGQQNQGNANASPDSNPDSSLGSNNNLDENNVAPQDEEEILERTVTLYFSDTNLMATYKEDHEIEAAAEDEWPKTALEAWMKGPKSEKLYGVVPPEVVIEYVKDVNGIAHVSFSEEIKSANLGSSGELALVEQLTLILQQFGYTQTQILVKGEIQETLLGHVTTNEPITAGNPEDYEYMK